ncbi:tail fiber assembly protein [Pseudomonas cichorii]|nr:tail fiber assembly protein [Pseudomonas cichorii]
MKYLEIIDGVVVSAFSGPQDSENWPNLVEVEDDDPRYVAFMAPLEPDKIALAVSTRDNFLSIAALRIAPLQDAVDLDDASEAEIALLKQWKQYRIAVNRVDLTADPIIWPEQPQ